MTRPEKIRTRSASVRELNHRLAQSERELRRTRQELESRKMAHQEEIQRVESEVQKLRTELRNLETKSGARSVVEPKPFPALFDVPIDAVGFLNAASAGDIDAALSLAPVLAMPESLKLCRWISMNALSTEQALKLIDYLSGAEEGDSMRDLCFQLCLRVKGPGIALRLARSYRSGTGTVVDETEAARFYWEAIGEGCVEAAVEFVLWLKERGALLDSATRGSLGEKLGAIRELSLATESRVVDLDYFASIMSWLPTARGFRLLLRADRMSWDSFQGNCVGFGPILMLIKTARGSLIGGYSAQPGRKMTTARNIPGAFIFILSSPKQAQPVRLYKVPGSYGYDICLYPLQLCTRCRNGFRGIPDVSYFDGDPQGNFQVGLVEVWAVAF